MTIQQVLYHFQHKLLPMWFYDSPKEFVGVLSEKPDALYEILSVLLERGDVENTFSAGEFKVEPVDVNDDSMALKIKYPKPVDAPLCHGAVAFFNKTFDDLMFFTIEVGEDIEGGFPVLCAWNKDGAHINYGKVSPDPDEQFVECIDKYLGIAK